MQKNIDIMSDEIYVDYEPIEFDEEDYDPIADMLFTLRLRYSDVMDNCWKPYRDAYKPLEQYFGRIFDDKGHYYEFMNGRGEVPEVNVKELERYYEKYYLHNAYEVYEMTKGEMEF